MNYWLMKSEPTAFSYDHLVRAAHATSCWDGVRNYQARNNLRRMRAGDRVFFYHSNCEPPAIVGIVEVVKEAYPDHTQFDPEDSHYDPRATRERPIWDLVDVRAVQSLPTPIALHTLRSTPGLETMALLRKGRLSVQPVTSQEWKTICRLGGLRGGQDGG
jgi:predicted RNA-binding protein with PUA-like domain